MIDVQSLVAMILPLLLAITLHEYAHGWVANRLGDPTARMLGRLTLNPIKHIDPLGTIILPLLLYLTHAPLFGWAKAIPVSPDNFKEPRKAMFWVACAGPGANMLMAVFWGAVAKLSLAGFFPAFLSGALGHMGYAGFGLNVVLAALNLLPFPPLDGSKMLACVLPYRYSRFLDTLEQYGLVIFLALSYTGILSIFLRPVTASLASLLGARYFFP